MRSHWTPIDAVRNRQALYLTQIHRFNELDSALRCIKLRVVGAQSFQRTNAILSAFRSSHVLPAATSEPARPESPRVRRCAEPHLRPRLGKIKSVSWRNCVAGHYPRSINRLAPTEHPATQSLCGVFRRGIEPFKVQKSHNPLNFGPKDAQQS